MVNVVFLLGAGFSVDAASAAGNPRLGDRRVSYPLVSDLIKPCFGLESIPPGQAIEQLFQASIDSGDREPVKRLYDLVMEADYYIAQCLRPDGSHPDNIYARFLTDFPTAPLLTFNYDSLPEIVLLGMRQWRPEDGYGVPVQTGLLGVDPSSIAECSRRCVLHLHGSLCVYPETSYIEERPGRAFDMLRPRSQPVYLFDPDSLGHCFFPFERISPGGSYRHVAERAIAPIPDKAKGLTGALIGIAYERAQALLRRADSLVVIGYSFNPHDFGSYDPLLAGRDDLNVVLVGPNAERLVPRMREAYPSLQWRYVPYLFRDWVRQGYPGAQHTRVV